MNQASENAFFRIVDRPEFSVHGEKPDKLTGMMKHHNPIASQRWSQDESSAVHLSTSISAAGPLRLIGQLFDQAEELQSRRTQARETELVETHFDFAALKDHADQLRSKLAVQFKALQRQYDVIESLHQQLEFRRLRDWQSGQMITQPAPVELPDTYDARALIGECDFATGRRVRKQRV